MLKPELNIPGKLDQYHADALDSLYHQDITSRALVFHEEQFLLSAPYQYPEIIENKQMFPIINSAPQGSNRYPIFHSVQ